MKTVLCLVLLIFTIRPAEARQKKNAAPAKPSIGVVARAQQHKILLRWMVNQPVAWKYANQYGFVVERYTIARNNEVLARPEKQSLTPQPLKPRSLPEWEPLARRDDFAAAIAQCLYGDGVSSSGAGFAGLSKSADELSQRFQFSVVAADRSFEAACFAGWGWIDSTVQTNEKYFYRVYTAIPATKLKVDTSGVVISLKDNGNLPAINNLHATSGNKQVQLGWDLAPLHDTYIGYFIERSEDGTSFAKISDLPISNIHQAGEKITDRATYADSLPANEKKYFYRMYGVTCFGEPGPKSAIVEGAGKNSFSARPRITNATMNKRNVELEWEMEEEVSNSIDHFELKHAVKPDGTYTVVNNKIDSRKRKTSYDRLLRSNYFTITAVTKNGSRTVSPPYFVQPIDSLPPAPPSGLRATIDSLGRVVLKWDANKEEDLMGYMVFRTNLSNEEPAQLTKTHIRPALFRDTVNVRSLNKEVYYLVVALDDHYNQSGFSTALKLIKPDKVPPAPPVFLHVFADRSSKAHISWARSNSPDVVAHRLLRKNISKKEKSWLLIKEFTGQTDTFFLDKETNGGDTYAYQLVAVDDSRNETPARMHATVVMPKSLVKPRVKEFSIVLSREEKAIFVSWKYEEKGVIEQQIYKAVAGGPLTLWKVLPAGQKTIRDKELSPVNVYKYAVRAAFSDGSYSAWVESDIEY
jgi:uncharacterized protein